MAHANRFSLISLMALGLAMPGLAQQTPASDAAAGPQQDDSRDVIVVTAQKREETVQDIAVAVTAISSELRDEIGLQTVQDYTNFSPGLSYSTANDRLGMRGVTRTSNNFGIRSGISNYVDGVYFSSAIPASREPIFVERVEVVRGPQGTLYGRDSIGGALNVISKRPSDTFSGEFRLGAGNFEQRMIQGRVTGPITDNIRYSVAGARNYEGEGFLTNASGLETEAGRRDDTYLEAQLEGDIGDRFTWWARYGSLSWSREGSPGGRTNAGSGQPYDTRFFPPGAVVPNSFFGLSGVPSGVVQQGNQRTNPNVGPGQDLTFNTDFTEFTDLFPTTEGAIEMIYSFDNFDVKYLGGYVWYHYNLQLDNDGGPVSSLNLGGRNISTGRVTDYNENRAWYSNEINFISTGDGPFQWVTGLYQYSENYTQPIYVTSNPPESGFIQRIGDVTGFNFGRPAPDLPDFTGRNKNSGSPQGGDLWYFSNNQGVNHAYGIFVQADYALNDQWKVAGGIRWSKDVMNARDYARVISHYGVESVLEGPNGLGPFAGLVGGQSVLNALIQPRIDVTSTLGGPDPTTITGANPCGLAGEGVVNARVTTTNSGAGCGGPTDRSRYGIYIDPVTGVGFRDLAASWQEVTGELRLDWTPDTDTLIYGKYNRGYKPGGLGCADTNCNLIPTPYTDKELTDAFEFGLKREWRDWNLITNAVLFYYDYQGYQVANLIVPEDPDGAGPLPRPLPYTSYVNLPETKTTGFELETIWRPIDPLRILFNYGYTDPKIGTSPALVNALDPWALEPGAQPIGTPAADGRRGQDLDGNILPFSPKHKIALNGTYTFEYEDGSTLDLSASYFWQDIGYSSIFNMWQTKIPSWDQTDARFSWTNGDGNVTFIGYVRNLFDDVVYDSRGAGRREGNTRNIRAGVCGTTPANSISHAVNPLGSLAQDCFTITETYRPPRMYGVELQFRF